MRFGQIDIPKRLVDASLDGSLVLFVGAGASKYPPTSLPTFDEFAKRIAATRPTARRDGEQPEVYLGRLKRDGLDVASVAKRLLTGREVEPNDMHRALTGLFDGPSSLRIVTTNQDLMLEEALSEREWTVPIYDGPALPLGREFTGLVYLHGSAANRPSGLVLTDDEFARAYITDGWARRFLVQLFSGCTVLFVGYGNNDTVVRYLQRGMPLATDGARYAMCRNSQAQDFQHLGIVPVVLGVPEPGQDPYEPQLTCVERWSEFSQSSHDGHVDRLERILSSPPPGEGEDADYLAVALENPELAPPFFRIAEQATWIDWLLERGLLAALQDGTADSPPTHQLARWLAEARGPAEERLQNVLATWAWRIGTRLWRELARQCAYADPRPELWPRLMDALVRAPGVESRWEHLAPCILKCSPHADRDTAMAVLSGATNVWLRPTPRMRFDESGGPNGVMEAEPDLSATVGTLHTLWESIFLPNLDVFGRDALLLAELRIHDVYRHLRTWGLADRTWDRFGMVRSTIDHSDQDHDHWRPTFLVDMARDCVAWLVRQSPSEGLALAETWIRRDEMMLRRLAIHTRRLSSQSAESDLDWLLNHDLVYGEGLKHEVFALIRSTWGQASLDTREAVLNRVDQAPYADEGSEELREIGVYEVFNLLQWIHQFAPEDKRVAERIAAIVREHPNWSSRERPDLESYTSSQGSISTSPRSANELGQLSPTEMADVLVHADKYIAKQMSTGDRYLTTTGLHMEFGTAATANLEWSLDVAEALLDVEEHSTSVWDALVAAWARSAIDDAILARISAFADRLPAVGRCRSVGDLLLQVSKEAQPSPARRACALAITGRAWLTRSQEPSGSETSDWLFRAINSLGGKLTQAWIDWGVRSRALASSEGEYEPGAFKSVIDTLTKGDDRDAMLARVLLASRIHHARWIDEHWALSKVPPYLDWNRDRLMAQASWDGFLQWGKWDDLILERLVGPFLSMFPHLDQLSEQARPRLSRCVGGIFLRSKGETYEGIVMGYVGAASTEERVHFIRAVMEIAREDGVRDRTAMWARRVRPYWENRLTGAPLPLAPEESAWLVSWAFAFPDNVQDALVLIERGPRPSNADGHLLRLLKESNLHLVAPHAVARLLLWLLVAGTVPFLALREATEIVELLRAAAVDNLDLAPIEAQVRRLGGG